MKILILNGPNLNLQGKRDTSIYGSVTFEEYLEGLSVRYADVELEYFQSNVEGELINALHATTGAVKVEGVSTDVAGVVFNAGGYTHTSVALRDAISAISTPVIEVHISQILSREDFRHVSMIAPSAIGSIMGFGLDSYRLAIEALLNR